MDSIFKVTDVQAFSINLPKPLDDIISINAVGEVPTTGWTALRLSQRFYVVPPADGIWDFDFIGDEPTGIVGQVVLPVAAQLVLPAPAWCKGVRVHAKSNDIVASLSGKPHIKATVSQTRLAKGHVIVKESLGSYDDSFQPTGNTKFDPWPHIEMKKLHHDLVLIVEGPDDQKIRDCIAKAAAAGLVAAIVAALITGGAALAAAISAFIAALEQCLGSAFTVRVEDQSHWIYWWT